MLTLKQITEQTELVIAGLKKKHFKNAEEAIAQAISLNDDRKKAQAQLDNNLAQGKVLAARIVQSRAVRSFSACSLRASRSAAAALSSAT